MKKKIVAISIMVCVNLLSANDIELVGKNVLKNSEDIKKILIDLEEVKQKLKLSPISQNLIEGDKITKTIGNVNIEKTKSSDELRARISTEIRISPSIYSELQEKLKKGKLLKNKNFNKDKNEFNGCTYVRNGFFVRKIIILFTRYERLFLL